MARFYPFDEISSREPAPQADVLWLAGEIAQLPAFAEGSAVLCGSVAWGQPTWRSDIDIALVKKKSAPDISRPIAKLVKAYDKSTKGRYVLPTVDVVIVGSESEKSVTRANLVRGSRPITEKQTVREYIEATRLQLADHIGSLAAMKGDPWLSFHKTYLADADGGREARRSAMRGYVSSVIGAWRQQPLRGAKGDPGEPLSEKQLDALGHVENFPVHLMRQITGEIGRYPKPDRGPDVQAAFSILPEQWVGKLADKLKPFSQINDQYLAIVAACRDANGRMTGPEYYGRLRDIVAPLPFSDIEEVVWEYLDA
jgi:hypothetical protein